MSAINTDEEKVGSGVLRPMEIPHAANPPRILDVPSRVTGHRIPNPGYVWTSHTGWVNEPRGWIQLLLFLYQYFKPEFMYGFFR